ncbi:Os04g0539150 [Oryza sativa Japonica Group]|uniref:Os04g0539150 protein n=1 Tax=Oryza sativa subsp. japonica TaxID=39947 RepID=A0A0P0WD31_ORYSJ|nr:uncharacterized protein LOC107275398 [Oryza sativa Japonica Group]BAS90278.1 Os04g0539150 [Oryza sativa Japonica Group]
MARSRHKGHTSKPLPLGPPLPVSIPLSFVAIFTIATKGTGHTQRNPPWRCQLPSSGMPPAVPYYPEAIATPPLTPSICRFHHHRAAPPEGANTTASPAIASATGPPPTSNSVAATLPLGE